MNSGGSEFMYDERSVHLLVSTLKDGWSLCPTAGHDAEYMIKLTQNGSLSSK